MTEENKKLIEEFGGQYKASTRRIYTKCVKDYAEEFDKVTKGNVLDFFNMKLSEGITKSTMKLIVHSIKQWADYLFNHGILKSKEFFKEQGFKRSVSELIQQSKSHSNRKPVPVYITESELNKMLALKSEYEEITASRNAALIALGAYAGLRRNEMMEAKWKNLSFDYKVITVYGKTGKSEVVMNHKITPILKRTKEVYQRWGIDSEYILISTTPQTFGQKTRYMQLNRIVSAISKEAIGRQITPHDLRHYFANSLFDMGIRLQDIQKQMRHKSEKSVIDYLVTHGSNRLEETQWAN